MQASLFTRCRVNAAGPASDAPDSGQMPTVFVNLTDVKASKFKDQWFWVPPNISREALAVAVSALTSGAPVDVWYIPNNAPPGPPYTQVVRLYLTMG